MIKNKSTLFVTVGVWLVPLFASAAGPTLKVLIEKILVLFDNLGLALMGLAAFLVAFGLMLYFGAGDDPAKLAQGISILQWGVLSLFVMVSMWGLVNLVLNTFFPTSSGSFNINNQLFNP